MKQHDRATARGVASAGAAAGAGIPRGLAAALFLSLLATATAAAQDESVNPGINEAFLDPELEVGDFVERFEREGREVYDHREKIVGVLGLEPGETVADVGAGTGLFEPLLSKGVGPEGKVIAVDIAPGFIERVRINALRDGLKNVDAHLGTERSVELPAASVDKVFICDTYHHFEFPAASLASIHRAMKPGGELVVVDFERIEGVSSEWILGHVRAGKEVFAAEIEAAGFEKIGEDDFLEENYVLHFRRVDGGGEADGDTE